MASKEGHKIIQNGWKIVGFVGTTRLSKNKILFFHPFDSTNPLISASTFIKAS